MQNPIDNPSRLQKPQQRLLRRYRHLKSWHKVAGVLGVNVSYVFQYVKYGIEPANDQIAACLGIRRKKRHARSINDHLAHDELMDMPADLLSYAIEHREVMA